MTKIFMVLGDNGGGECSTIFGLYPTEELAVQRLDSLTESYEDGEDGCEYMHVKEVSVGPQGADCSISVEG